MQLEHNLDEEVNGPVCLELCVLMNCIAGLSARYDMPHGHLCASTIDHE